MIINNQLVFPSPYLGLSLKYTSRRSIVGRILVSVPLFGAISEILMMKWLRVPKPFFFRPLIWGYLWNLQSNLKASTALMVGFPSPYLGLSLKWFYYRTNRIWWNCFPSPYLGLSLKSLSKCAVCVWNAVFRPLIWGYLWNERSNIIHDYHGFPSPYLGLSLKCYIDGYRY